LNPEIKKILNSLKCPVCNCQIDMTNDSQYLYKCSQYCCVSNSKHYTIYIISYDDKAFIELETVIIYDGNFQYEIRKRYIQDLNSSINTTLYIRKVDDENRILDNFKMKVIALNGSHFEFNKTNSIKMLNRIKTLLLFQ